VITSNGSTRSRPLQHHHGGAHPQPRAQRQRGVAEQVEWGGEAVAATLGEHRDARGPPLELVGQAELAAQRLDVTVGHEQLVVVALDPVPVADVERRRLAAEPGPALVDVADCWSETPCSASVPSA
jgi:hypothetical protein